MTKAQTTTTIETDLLGFIEQRTRKAWTPDTDLFAAGGMSSLFAMQLVMFLESTFDVEIDGDDLKLDNFRTINAMAALVRRLRDRDRGA